MFPVTDAFEYEYEGTTIVYGRGQIGTLGSFLAERNFENALVVCGPHVGANDDVIEPLEEGLGDRLAGVFDETTPAKSAETIYEGIEVVRDLDPDVLIGVGGGSSLDTARQMSAFAADGRPLSYFREEALSGRTESPEPAGPQIPVIVVPTTFAGADVSNSGSIVFVTAEDSPTGQPIRLRGKTNPAAVVCDPDLYETTPQTALARSAMNGFNKAVETVYGRNGTPISDATALHALRHLRDGFVSLGSGDPEAMERAVVGMILAQFERQVSVVHAFGHAFSARYPVQQGLIHAIVVPHVLRYVLENTDGHDELLAEGLGVDRTAVEDDELTESIVDEVIAVRNSFDLPTRLRSVDVVDRSDFPALAAYVLDDYSMDLAPADLDPSQREIADVLEAAW